MGRSCLVCSFTSKVVHLEWSNIVRGKACNRSIGALSTPILFIVCFLQLSTSLSDIHAHVFHIGIEIGEIRFVLPTAHMRCWISVTRSSTLLDGLIGTIGPLLVTIVFFFSFQLVMIE